MRQGDNGPMYFFELRLQKAWYLGVEGLVLFVLGLLCLVAPRFAAETLLFIFAVVLLADGFLLIVAAYLNKADERLWALITMRAGLEILIGLIALRYETLTTTVIVVIFSLGLMFRGVLLFIAFVEHDTPVRHQRLLFFSAVVSFALGVFLLVSPFSGEYAFMLFIGVYLVTDGLQGLSAAWLKMSLKDWVEELVDDLIADAGT